MMQFCLSDTSPCWGGLLPRFMGCWITEACCKFQFQFLDLAFSNLKRNHGWLVCIGTCSLSIRNSCYCWHRLRSVTPLDMSCPMYHLQPWLSLSRTLLKVQQLIFTTFVGMKYASLFIYYYACVMAQLYISAGCLE